MLQVPAKLIPLLAAGKGRLLSIHDNFEMQDSHIRVVHDKAVQCASYMETPVDWLFIIQTAREQRARGASLI